MTVLKPIDAEMAAGGSSRGQRGQELKNGFGKPAMAGFAKGFLRLRRRRHPGGKKAKRAKEVEEFAQRPVAPRSAVRSSARECCGVMVEGEGRTRGQTVGNARNAPQNDKK